MFFLNFEMLKNAHFVEETIHITPKRPITAEEMKGLKKEEQKEREERMERECKEKTHNLSLHSHPSSQLLYSVRG